MSVLRTASSNYTFNAGVIKDRLWLYFNFDHQKKSSAALFLSDSRLSSAEALFKEKKPGPAFSILSKGEKYLLVAFEEEEKARSEGKDTTSDLIKLALTGLRHRKVIEENIAPISPEDVRPEIFEIENYSKNIYKMSRDVLNSEGIVPPENPFNGQ